MSQILYTDVLKVDRDVAHNVMAIHICFKCMFQIFHMLQTYVASASSGCCIYMHVASIYFKYFRCFIRILQVFYLDVAYVCNGFQVFSNAFASISDAYLKCFFFLYVATVAFECFKSRSGVAHGMRVENGWQRRRRSGLHGPAAGALARCATLASWIGRPGTTKSLSKIIQALLLIGIRS
jgi:hypothetical protein